MKKELIFDKNNRSKTISFYSENKFFSITGLIVLNKENIIIDLNEKIIATIIYANQELSNQTFKIEFLKDGQYYKLKNLLPELQNNNKATISFENLDFENYRFELEYDDIDYKLPDEAFKEFKEHIRSQINDKIFFSAPFGKGKTTFIDYFFKHHSKEYEVFKVCPVNYSIAPNKDIFKYIKVDLLIQLISKGSKFDKEEFSDTLLAQQFAINNSTSILKAILKIALSLNKPTTHLTKVVDLISKEFTKFQKYKAESEVDDLDKVEQYIEKIYGEEGSLFEDDFYTQLIRQLVEQIEEAKKETVLIIDDLDRMDPDHIFRILNVISAHYDSYSLDEKHYKNKFGLSKIILVADINNVKSIYKHKFGKNVDFDGYINKFYSNSVFKLDSIRVGHEILAEFFKSNSRSDYAPSLRLLDKFNQLELLSLRQIIRIRNSFNFSSFKLDRVKNFKNSRFFRSGLYTPILSFLIDLFHSKENFIEIIENRVRNSKLKVDTTIDTICRHLLGVIPSTFDNKIGSYFLNGKQLEFKHKNSFTGYEADEIKLKRKDGHKEDFSEFSLDDFCDLLIDNIKNFR